MKLNSRIALKPLLIESSNLNYLTVGIKTLKLASTLHENYLSKGQIQKGGVLNLVLSKRSIVNAKLDAEFDTPFCYIAEFVKTGDMLTLCNNYRNHFISNPSNVIKLEKFFDKYPIAI